MDETTAVDLLDRVGTLFCSTLDVKEIVDFIVRAAVERVGCDSATLFLCDEPAGSLRAVSTWPYREEVAQVRVFAPGEGVVGWAVEQGQVVAVDDATQDRRFADIGDPAYAPRSYLVAPLSNPRHTVGALTLTRHEVRPFTPVEQALVRVLAQQAAIAIDNGTLHEQQARQLEEIARRTRELELANTRIAEISRLKSDFLAGMSHELRTPLNGILGFSEILKDDLAGDLDEAQRRECAEQIHRSGRRLLELVNDVLDLSKIEAGRMQLNVERVPVAAALAEVRNITNQHTERFGLELTTEFEPEDIAVLADRSKLKQVLYNLLSNSIKFTEPGGSITVRARSEDHQVVISVTDNGRGMSPEELAQAFEEFWQGDTPAARRGDGTGLGLSLVRRIVEMHGGTIDAVSSPGSGSTFTVRLPAVREAATGEAQGRILLVEDDRGSRELVSAVLTGSGFAVEVAEDREQSLHKLRTNAYDLVLMDVQLPGLDGLELMRTLKSDPRTAAIPVVALSARAMRGDEPEALAAGFSGYIPKPIDVAHFVEQITSQLEAASR